MTLFKWPGRTSKSAFRDRVSAVFREAFPQATFEFPGELEIRISGLSSLKSLDVWLGRAYEEFLKTPAEADEIIQRHVRAALVLATDSPIDPTKIIPTIKPRGWLESQQARHSNQLESTRFDPWVEPYNSELVVVYAEYTEGIRFVKRSDLESLGLPVEVMRGRALDNLRGVIPQIKVVGEDGVYLLGAGGTLDASLVMLGEVLADPRLQIRGNPLMAVSDRGTFWIADDSSPRAVFEATVAVARCHRSQQYPISLQLFRKAQDKWEPLDPSPADDTHPIPNLAVIDVHTVKKEGGSNLDVVIASPLQADARSIYRLARKLDGYLQDINSEGYREECGAPTAKTTSIIVHLHPRSHPAIEAVLHMAVGWAEAGNASLQIEKIGPVAVT